MKRITPRKYENAKKFVQKQNLSSQKAYSDWSKSGKRPKDIPANPGRTYKDEWNGWGDWLGTGNVAGVNRVYRSYDDAKKFARKHNLKRKDDWIKYKKTDDYPSRPDNFYKEWTTWGDFLGTENIAPINKKYLSFEDARKFVQSLKLKSRSEWQKYCNSGKKPKDIPKHPEDTYKNKGFTTVGDWLGTGYVANRKREYLSWKEAKPVYRKLAKEYGLKGPTEWIKFAKTHKKLLEKLNIPGTPSVSYSKEKEWERSMKNG